MTLIHSISDLDSWHQLLSGQTVALVPTMGALHRGHIALIEQAVGEADSVVVSIFVNRLQFTDSLDFEHYPRTLDDDYDKCIQAGASVVFAPSHDDLFPSGFAGYLSPPEVACGFEGSSRPGHFAGVVTVVHRLLGIVHPEVAVFGAKDYQQVAVIRAMSSDLHPGVRISTVDTVRDTDGLALSSRNSRLSPTSRVKATLIYRALGEIERLYAKGEDDCKKLKSAAIDMLSCEPELHVDYLEIVNKVSLQSSDKAKDCVALFAGVIGGVRLIDNVVLE